MKIKLEITPLINRQVYFLMNNKIYTGIIESYTLSVGAGGYSIRLYLKIGSEGMYHDHDKCFFTKEELLKSL